MRDPPHPGQVLFDEYMWEDEISQNQLAVAMGVSPRRVNEIILGKRRITADTAVRLELVLCTPALMWMKLQAEHDLAKVYRRGVEGVDLTRRYGRMPEDYCPVDPPPEDY